MIGHTCRVLAIAVILAGCSHARPDPCVPVKIEAGWVCGLERVADDGSLYASFRGVPYAKQPVDELRFKELEPLEPWGDIHFDARTEGPICFQTDVLYGKLMHKHSMSEACIRANIHVPIDAIPKSSWRPARELEPPRQTFSYKEESIEDMPASTDLPAPEGLHTTTGLPTITDLPTPTGLPILVFIHGGGFAFGSGHTDVHGPEYLVSKNVIVITFNYRLNVFGFLSLNSTMVPGNAGLRDMITLLRWVQQNARAFGGDPDNVTLAGQSAGAIAAHLLTLSKAAEGLFKRAILMSGTAISSFYSPSPFFAQYIKNHLLTVLGINSTTDPDEIYEQLIKLPAEKLYGANNFLIDQIGFTTFVPTVETSFPGVTTVVDDYPDNLVAQGRGKDIPLLVGYTDSECETFRGRLEEFDLVEKAKENPLIIVPAKTLFTTPKALLPDVAKKMLVYSKYYNGTVSVDGFVKSCTDGFYEYPVLKLVEVRESTASAPTYVYRFTYDSDNSIIKKEKQYNFHGAGHVDDMTYVFKVNSVLGSQSSWPPKNDDDYMKQLMPSFFVNFMTYSQPICVDKKWPATNSKDYLYEDIKGPSEYEVKSISSRQQEIERFFDTLNIVE